MKIALYPGSFDPITKGHEDIVLRMLPLFDKFYIALGENIDKKSLFPLSQRITWINNCFIDISKVEVVSYEGLTVDLCKKLQVNYIIRGLRNSVDFLYETDLARLNRDLTGIETIFCVASSNFAHISSSAVRELYVNNGNYQQFMPERCFK